MPAEASAAEGYGLLLVPEPPMVRTIFFAEGGKQRLVFPYTMFGLFYFRNANFQYSLKRLHVMFSQTPFTGEREDKLYGLPLRNHDGAFATCFYQWDGEQTAEKFAHLIINQYWMSPYAEYHDWASWWTGRYQALNPTFAKEWADASARKDYQWIFDQTLLQPDHHVTLGRLLDANKAHTKQGGVEVLQLDVPKTEIKF